MRMSVGDAANTAGARPRRADAGASAAAFTRARRVIGERATPRLYGVANARARDGETSPELAGTIRARDGGQFRTPRGETFTPGSWVLQPGVAASVPVVLRLVRSPGGHADVVGLLFRERRQLHPEMIEVEPCDFLVEVLRQDVHLPAVL